MVESRRSLGKDIWGTLFVQGASAALLFLSGLLLTRVLSPAEFGAYDYIDVWVEVLMFFALLGFDRLLILKVSVFMAQQQYRLVRGIIRLAYGVSISLSLILGLAFCVLAYLYFSHLALPLNPAEQLTRLNLLPLVTILLLGRVLLKLNQVILQGFRKTTLSYIPDYLIRPLLLIIFVFCVWSIRGVNAYSALVVHIFVAGFCVVLSLYLLQRFGLASVKDAASEYLSKDWLKAALPFTLISALSLLNLRGGGAILGTIANFETIALYGVAVRLTAIISLALTATSAVMAPRIAALYAQGQHEELQRIVTFSSRLIAVATLPILVLLVVEGQTVLRFFGEIYPTAYNALLILCVSQVFIAATGVVGWIIIMTGNERVMAIVLAIATAIHILGMLLLAPRYGVEGAALATSISNIFTTFSLSIFSYRRLKINPTSF